jgi:glyoxylase-like metal-dependent hydrolase (beta-lactamase superfamily II)
MPAARFLKMPWPERDERWEVPWVPIADGETTDAGDISLTAVHTPGHAPDHLCFFHGATGAVFGGDLAIIGTTVWIPAAQYGDLAAYIASLERVLALHPARIFPGHGQVIDDPASLLRNVIAHRLRREGQILDALRRGDARTDAIVTGIYPGLDERFVSRARETVTAHLLKLERDGRVGRTGEAWHITGS